MAAPSSCREAAASHCHGHMFPWPSIGPASRVSPPGPNCFETAAGRGCAAQRRQARLDSSATSQRGNWRPMFSPPQRQTRKLQGIVERGEIVGQLGRKASCFRDCRWSGAPHRQGGPARRPVLPRLRATQIKRFGSEERLRVLQVAAELHQLTLCLLVFPVTRLLL